MLKRLALSAAIALSLASGVQAESVVRYGISLADIPLTSGQPDRGAGAYKFTGYTIYDPLVAWEMDVADRPGKLVPGLATEWKVDDADKTKSLYVKWRVEQLLREEGQEQKGEEKQHEKDDVQPQEEHPKPASRSKGILAYITTVLGLVFVVVIGQALGKGCGRAVVRGNSPNQDARGTTSDSVPDTGGGYSSSQRRYQEELFHATDHTHPKAGVNSGQLTT